MPCLIHLPAKFAARHDMPLRRCSDATPRSGVSSAVEADFEVVVSAMVLVRLRIVYAISDVPPSRSLTMRSKLRMFSSDSHEARPIGFGSSVLDFID